ncbi:MAG: PspC domain-containing protein [Candidatus Pacebacteria bacterium]|nr:PspC domain-containing protein [Candidatus Paceibacterota bacterium]
MSLNRPKNDRIIAGVASGLARRFDIPVWLVRLLFVILIPLPPSALFIYIVLWILIPEGPDYTILS